MIQDLVDENSISENCLCVNVFVERLTSLPDSLLECFLQLYLARTMVEHLAQLTQQIVDSRLYAGRIGTTLELFSLAPY